MIFRQDRNSFSLSVTHPAADYFSGTWLILAGIDSTPPHIAIAAGGKYYSLSLKRVDTGIPLQTFMKSMERKNTPVVFVKIENNASTDLLYPCFEKYPALGKGKHTCLSPIRDYFSKVYSGTFMQSDLVFELLAEADKMNLLSDSHLLGFNSSSEVTIPKYTVNEVMEWISSRK